MKIQIRIIVVLIAFLALSIPALQSCKKYEEGPAFSLASRKGRVANTWKVENYKINGSDFTSLVAGYTETFSKGGSYSYALGSLSGTGNWDFQNKDEEIRLTGSDDQSSRTLYILKLEQKSFWYYYLVDGDRHELHLTGN